MKNSGSRSRFRFIIFAIIAVVCFIFIARNVNLWNSAGFERSSNGIYDDDRFEMWEQIWHFVTDNYFVGYGLGGDYFTYGFYTHNIILDFILELGILGALAMIYVFLRTYRKIYSLTKVNSIFVVIMILFLFGTVMTMFSGYWITTDSIWLSFGVAIIGFDYHHQSHSRRLLFRNKRQRIR